MYVVGGVQNQGFGTAGEILLRLGNVAYACAAGP